MTDIRLPPDKVTGLMLGAAAGDALGWPQELRSSIVGGQKERDHAHPEPRFRAWVRMSGNRFSGRYHDPVKAGHYSDDTQLLCVVARSLLSGDGWYDRLTRIELPAWRVYQRGGGGAVLSAAASWAQGRPPWMAGRSARQRDTVERYRNAGANGVAMRIAPHVVVRPGEANEQLYQRIVEDGLTTHGHPRALVGALVYAGALRAALSSAGTINYGSLIEAGRALSIDEDVAVKMLPADWGDLAAMERFREAWRAARTECNEMFGIIERSLSRGAMSDPEEVLQQIGCADSPVSGAGTVTALGAIYLASRAAARPMSGLLTAAFLRRADTDTLASMTGAVLGAIHGTDWLGDLLYVQDAEYLTSLGDALSEGRISMPPQPSRSVTELMADFPSRLATVPIGGFGEFVDGREYMVVGREVLDGEKRRRATLSLDGGQTVYIDLRSAGDRELDGPPSPIASESTGNPPASHPGQPSRNTSSAATVEVSLLTSNSHQTGAFYARLLGRNVEVLSHRRVRIENYLTFYEAEGSKLLGTEQVVISLVVRDLEDAARQFDFEIVDGPFGLEARGWDPDGRRVVLGQRS